MKTSSKIFNTCFISLYIMLLLLAAAGNVLVFRAAIDGYKSVSKTEVAVNTPQQRFQRVIRDEGSPINVYVDTETNVMYLIRNSAGGICVMVDADGNPLLWDGGKTK